VEINKPERFLTVERLGKIASEFDWPEAYSLRDDWPDGVIMGFPKSSLYFREGPDGEMGLEFLSEDTGIDDVLSLIDALTVLVPNYETSPDPFPHLNLNNDTSIYASSEKVENGIRDICILLNEYLIPHIQGDFSWVKKYLASVS
jgi:hypothetical protein